MVRPVRSQLSQESSDVNSFAADVAASAVRLAPAVLPRPRLACPSAIMFDLDGTLVDTMGHFADLAADVMVRRYGLARRNARKLYLQTSGIPFCKQLEVIFGAAAENEEAAAEFETRKHAVASAAEMDPATHAALEGLRARGVALIVSSNGMQDHVDQFAARASGLFRIALGFGGGLGKGEPHVRVVCERLGVDRDSLLFVGDSIRDGEIAGDSGVRFIGKAGTFTADQMRHRFPESHVVHHLGELGTLF